MLQPTLNHLIGAHMPTSKGLGNAVREGRKIGCTAVQVFTSSPQTWRAGPVTQEKVDDFKAAMVETEINDVVCHDSYLINLCAVDPAMREKSVQGLTDELLRASLYGITYVVSHMGAHMGQGEDCGLRTVAESALEVLGNTPETVSLLMETTAGQGTCLNCRFEHLAALLELCKGHSRLGICLDTCHIFASGYDIRTGEGYSRTFEEFHRLIGLDRLKVIHCNDSKKPLGSRVDRHEHIGKGEIGSEAFELLVNDPRFFKIPILVETPEDDEGNHESNVAKLWGLAKD